MHTPRCWVIISANISQHKVVIGPDKDNRNYIAQCLATKFRLNLSNASFKFERVPDKDKQKIL